MGSQKHAIVARSTAKVKYRALAATTVELMWFTNLLKRLGYSLSSPTLHYDNINAINMVKNPIFHHCTKHIEIDVHFVLKQVSREAPVLAHVSE